ncbi:hypothetical protein [Spirosoma radiotolerans]|uniref:Lipocalin-like domain-containing protein n=1 Tax=Spirosoma radiotolerans TaxID=1379870 RepID=A0A0E3VAA9_9BACT|nr:hypothetical protein [Spirosoma radiotolerans]AKD57911.1 hypothetical protein SD10_26425 [Spirosoma radiotolerans]
MKKLLLFLFVAVAFTACKKGSEVAPQPNTVLADKFVGSYKLTSFRYTDSQTDLDLPTLPTTSNGKMVSGTVTLTKISDTKVNMKLLLKTSGLDDYAQDFGDLDIKQEGSEYGLFSGTTRIADAEGSTVIFNYSETDQSTNETMAMAFVAKR